jgi:chromate transporter
MTDKPFLKLFSVFFRVGLCSIGGGYVMLPMLRREVVERQRWITDEEMINFYAIGQSTPGIIAVNTATFVGNKLGGLLGALSATVGVVLPSLIIITILAAFFAGYQDHPGVEQAFRGIRVAVAVLLCVTLFELVRGHVRHWVAWLLLLGAFAAVAIGHSSPIPVICAAGIIGLWLDPARREAS